LDFYLLTLKYFSYQDEISYFSTGFQTVGSTCGTGAATCAIGCSAGANATYFLATRSQNGTTALADIPASNCNKSTFTAGSGGRISTTAGAIDQWTINESKNLLNTTSGI